MFEKGDVVVYRADGICDIVDIATVDIPGLDQDRMYYILNMRNNTGKIYLAVDGDTSRMRKLISKEEAMELISKVQEIEPLELRDRRKPEECYKEALKKNDCTELLKLIKCIYFRKKQRLDEGKKPTAADEKYMKIAEDALYQELGEALDIPNDQVLDYLIKRMEGEGLQSAENFIRE